MLAGTPWTEVADTQQALSGISGVSEKSHNLKIISYKLCPETYAYQSTSPIKLEMYFQNRFSSQYLHRRSQLFPTTQTHQGYKFQSNKI